jgi:hypothetical protein
MYQHTPMASRGPDDAVVVISVIREADRIFLWRREYHSDTLPVLNIFFIRGRGLGRELRGSTRRSGPLPIKLTRMLIAAGFSIGYCAERHGLQMIAASRNPAVIPVFL